MTCADNCSSCSHGRAAVAAASGGLRTVGWGCGGKGCHRSYPPARYPAVLPFCTTNQIQMHIPSSQRAHSRAVDEIMVDCTLRTGAARARARERSTPSANRPTKWNLKVSEKPCGSESLRNRFLTVFRKKNDKLESGFILSIASTRSRSSSVVWALTPSLSLKATRSDNDLARFAKSVYSRSAKA